MSDRHSGDWSVHGRGWYRRLVDRLPDVVALVDAEWTVRYVNSTVDALLGYDAPTLIGDALTDYVHPEDRASLTSAKDGLRPEDPQTVTVRVRTVEGDWEWLTVALRPLTNNSDSEVIVTARSFAGRKAGEEGEEPATTKRRKELALEGANLGVWDWDMRTDDVERDELLTEMLGYTPEEMGDHLADWERLVHPEGKRRHDEALAEHIEADTPYYECEYRLRTAAGEWKWVQTIGTVVERDAQGRPVRAVGIHQDVDDRKRAELALEEEREKYRSLFEDTSDAMMLLDREGFFDCNQRTLELFGIESVDAFEDHAPWDLSPATQPNGRDSKRAANELIEEAMESGGAFFEWRHERGDGTEFPSEVQLSRFQLDGRPVLHARVRDISERKAYERELEAVNTRLQFTLEETETGIWDWELGADTLSWDDASRELLGFDPGAVPAAFEEFVGIIHDADVPDLRDEIHATLQSGAKLETEFRIRAAAGEWQWIQVRGAVRYDETGEPERLLGILTDVTERKRREEAIRRERDLNRRLQTVLADTRTRQSLEDRLTEQLHEHGYALAWIGERIGEEVVPRSAGGGTRYVENVDRHLDDPGSEAEPSVRAAATGQPQFHDDLDGMSAPWTKTAGKYNYRSAAAIPIDYRDVSYGVLALYHETPDRFDVSERQLLTELAETVAFAIHSHATRDALAADRRVRVTVELSEGYYLVDLAQAGAFETCERVTVEGTVRKNDDEVIQYLTVTGDELESVSEAVTANPAVRDLEATIDERSMRCQVTVTDRVPEAFLVSRGVKVDSTDVVGDAARIAIELLDEADVTSTVEAIGDAFGTESVRAIRQRKTHVGDSETTLAKTSDLTDKQATALKAAYHGGYFTRPRHNTATEIAESLGVSHSTFLQHLHRAQEKVFAEILESDPS